MNLIDKTQQQIKELIMNHEYDTNGYLPSEGELSQKFGVSRTTVREAVRSLEIRGFIQRIHGKGLRVIDNSMQALSRSVNDMMERGERPFQELLEVRTIIEIEAAGLAAKRITQDELDKLEECVVLMENAKQNTELYNKCDVDFHLMVAGASKNETLLALVQAYLPIFLKRIRIFEPLSYNTESAFHYHRKIFEALKRRNVEEAKDGMRTHLLAPGEIVEKGNQVLHEWRD